MQCPRFTLLGFHTLTRGALGLIFAGFTQTFAASVDSTPVLQPHQVVLGNINFSGPGARSETVNGCHLALTLAHDPQNPKFQVMVDGKIVPGFDDVLPKSLTFSMDGEHFAFIAVKDGKQSAVIDGKAGPWYDNVSFPTVSFQVGTDIIRLFSADDKHTAYTAQNGTKWLVVTDGKPGPEFDQIDDLQLIINSDPCFPQANRPHIDPLVWGGLYQEPLWSPLHLMANGPVFTPDGKHVIYRGVHKQGNKHLSEQLVLDGIPGPSFDGADYVRISPDGRHFAYTGYTASHHQIAVVDGVPGPEFQGVSGEDLFVFNPDGLHVAYKAEDADGHLHVVEDGKIGPASDDDVQDLSFSSDGKHVAYTLTKYTPNSAQTWIMMDGAPLPEIDGMMVKEFKFSSQGGHVAYFAANGRQQEFVVDGQARPSLGSQWWYFSPDGQHLAYITTVNGRSHQMILDGKAGPEVGDINPYSVKFSTVGGHLTYVAAPIGNSKKSVVVVDQGVGPEFDAIFQTFPIFSSDGKHYAYVAKKGNLLQMVVDGKPGPDLYNVDLDSVQFSPDGQRLLYISLTGSQQTIVVNTTPNSKFDEIRKGSLAFSPDGKHYAYVAKKDNGKWLAAVDGMAGPEFDKIGDKNVIFSSDSKHWAYVAQTGGDQQLIIDGVPGPNFSGVAAGPIECKDGHLEYLAFNRNGDKTNLLRVSIPGFGAAKP